MVKKGEEVDVKATMGAGDADDNKNSADGTVADKPLEDKKPSPVGSAHDREHSTEKLMASSEEPVPVKTLDPAPVPVGTNPLAEK